MCVRLLQFVVQNRFQPIGRGQRRECISAGPICAPAAGIRRAGTKLSAIIPFSRGLEVTVRTRNAFTLIELLVVIAIIAILAAILFPVFAQARDKSRQATCLSNFKQIGVGVMMYVQDWDDCYPNNRLFTFPGGSEGVQKLVTWKTATHPYVKNLSVYRCPSNRNNNKPDETKGDDAFGLPVFPISYAYNGSALWSAADTKTVIPLASVPEPARYLMLIESNAAYSDYGIWGMADAGERGTSFFVHSSKQMQALYFDGHAKSTRFSQTLGTSDDDQQWTWIKDRLPAVTDARKLLARDPKLQAKVQ
jgi:prepilin-type N-terminal cleavage/methylation domain-containing protein/prepilin-type processing-associated H-X9-DG protein